MDTAAILHDLTHADGLPREALDAANERRAELTPRFLAEIDRWLAAGPRERAEPSPLFFVFHLLGSWGETAAYRPLARLLRARAEDVDCLLGDCTTETSHRVMASVFDGDPAPLYEIILDPKADEYVRSRMCEALAMLVHRGQLDRGAAAGFLAEAHGKLRPRAPCFVWQGWQSAIAMLGLSEIKAQVRDAFTRGFVDKTWLGYAHFERDLALALETPEQPFTSPSGEFEAFGDAVTEMQDWHLARTEGQDDAHPDAGSYAAIGSMFNSGRDWLPEQPYVNPKKIGRNDPCPCGSGKKYKKCCGA